ncbi:unnamed protein product [Mucor hiemalis]
MTDSYDQYADQLLNSAFQNARKTPAINTSPEDQLLNQLFQNARYSVPATPSPMFGNNPTSNEWFLLQQLQQQKMLLERQQQMMSPSVFHQVPIQSSTAAIQEEAPIASPVKKIARVPVHSDPVILEDSIVEPTQQPQPQQYNNTGVSQPPLNKKKSFLRSLSLKRPSNKDLAAAAVAVATTAIAAKSLKEQYNERKREEQEMIRAEKERKRQEKERKMANKKAAKLTPVAATSDYEEEPETEYQSTSQPKYVDRNPSFWKPREEKPKGWWKGQRGTKNEQQYNEEVEYEEEEEEEEEVVPVVIAPPVKTKKVVKRVAVPKPVPSIKASKPKRPMAFKQPSPRKSKPEKKKKGGKNTKGTTNETSTNVVAQPMYMMPQQMYQPNYYQQPMMMPQQFMPGSYYPQMMGQVPQQQPAQPERRSSPARKKSIYNPRDTANDKCSIM